MEKTMKIEGMMCGHCEARVKKALEAVDGVKEAIVSHEKKNAIVTLEKEVANDVLKEAVEDCRDRENKSIILHSTRVGLGRNQSDDFRDSQLRTIAGPLLSSYAYKEKENVFKHYIINENISKEEAEKISIDILGYCPKSLIKSVYQA